MSADNGIYILKTRDQYRVAHFQNAEYMYYSYLTENYSNRIISTRAIELWGDCKFTRKESVALHLAHKWEKRLFICEHGVNIVECNKTWKELLKEAKIYAKKEIQAVSNRNERCVDIRMLQKIADGYYLHEWLHKEQYNKDLRLHDCGYWSVCDDRGCKCAIEKNVDGFNNEIYTKMKNELVD